MGTSGVIYDEQENQRLSDIMSKQEDIFVGLEENEGKDKKIIRYAVIVGGSVLILLLLKLALKRK